MPLCFGRNKSMSTDPQIREFEKRIAGEARVDQKNLDHSMRDMKGAEKTHLNAMKAVDRAQHELDKAIAKEHKSAQALNNAQRLHEAAVADEQNAEKTLTLKRQYQQKLEDELQKRKASVNDFQHRKDVNDQFRETKLSEIHADAASRAGSRATSINRGPFPVGNGSGSTGGPGKKPQQAIQQQPLRESPEPITNDVPSQAPTSMNRGGVSGAGGGFA